MAGAPQDDMSTHKRSTDVGNELEGNESFADSMKKNMAQNVTSYVSLDVKYIYIK